VLGRGGGAKGVWDAVDTNPDLGGQNIPPQKKPIEMAVDTTGGRHERNWRELAFCRWIYFRLHSKIFPALLRPGRSPHRHSPSPPDPACGSASGRSLLSTVAWAVYGVA